MIKITGYNSKRLTEIAEQTITLIAPSKTYNIAGLACSFAVIPDDSLRRRFVRASAMIVPHVNLLGFEAALAAYRHGGEWLAAQIDYLRRGGATVALNLGVGHGASVREVQQRIDREQLDAIRSAVTQVHASDNLLDYLQRLVAYTRQSAEFAVGLSPRGSLALLECARTWAVMHNRGHVVPEDVQMVLPAVAAHRLVPSGDYAGDGFALVALLQRSVDVVRP